MWSTRHSTGTLLVQPSTAFSNRSDTVPPVEFEQVYYRNEATPVTVGRSQRKTVSGKPGAVQLV